MSQLEGSKIFTKIEDYKIPTAKFGIFSNIDEAVEYLKKYNHPIVVKADGLASGKVYICEDIKHSTNAITEIFNGKFEKQKMY